MEMPSSFQSKAPIEVTLPLVERLGTFDTKPQDAQTNALLPLDSLLHSRHSREDGIREHCLETYTVPDQDLSNDKALRLGGCHVKHLELLAGLGVVPVTGG